VRRLIALVSSAAPTASAILLRMSDSLFGGIRTVTDPPEESNSMPRNGHRREGGSRFERVSRSPSRMKIFEMTPGARWQVA